MLRSYGLRFAIVAAMALLLTACPEEEPEEVAAEPGVEPDEPEVEEEPVQPAEEERFLIGVSFPSPVSPLYVAMSEGIEAKADELGVDVLIVYAEDDVLTQVDQLDDLIASGVDGILASPIDFDAAQPAYEEVRAAGIPIMSIARNTDPALEDSFIGASWETYGREIAEWTCEAVGGNATVAMLKGPAGASFVEEMEAGYKSYVESECPGMDIVFETNLVPLTEDEGLRGAQDALAAHPDLDVIYANQDDLARGAILVLEEQGIPYENVIVTGFNGDPGAVQALREGRLDMTIALRPFHWGLLGLETMVAYLRGESVPELVEIETITLTQEAVEDHDPDELR